MYRCEECEYYAYDDDNEEYVCTKEMDEDDYSVLIRGGFENCPFFRDGDEYSVVRHQA